MTPNLRSAVALMAYTLLFSFASMAYGQSLPAASPPPTWNAVGVANEADGTGRILWDRSDGASGLWSMVVNNMASLIGPTYGPFSDAEGTWTAKAVSGGPNGTAVVLWTRSDGAAGLWTMSAQDTALTVGAVYGPYSDSSGTWAAQSISTAPDGTSRILWTRSDGAAGLWTMNAADTVTNVGPTYGPFADSLGTWSAEGVGVPGDGTARMLWERTDGAAGIWVLNAANTETVIGPVYTSPGPVFMLPVTHGPGTMEPSDQPEGMTGGVYRHSLGVYADGTSRILWGHVNGSENIVTYDATGTQTNVGETYGPFTDFTALTLSCGGNGSRCLWVRSDRAAGLWSYAADNSNTVIGSVYGPF